MSTPAQSLPDLDRVSFPGSVQGVMASAGAAPGPSSTLVRSALNQTEYQATLPFSVALKMRNFEELQDRINRSEIVPLEEMVDRYFPTTADYKLVAEWLSSQGLAVRPAETHNLSVFADGSVSQIEKAFQTKFARVTSLGLEASSAITAPSLPARIAKAALGVNGLQPQLHPKPHSKITSGQPQKLINNAPPYTIGEIAGAYEATALGVNGSGQKIGVVIDTFPASSDLLSFWQSNSIAQSLSNIEKVQVVPGVLPNPSGEESLDVEWSSGIAAGAKVRIYATTDLGFAHLDQAYQAILNDLPTQPGLRQISLSYGLGELYESANQMQTDAQYFASLAARGVTIFVSSGDGGSTPGLNGFGDNSGPVQVMAPANDPNVTSVGGTSLHLTSSIGAVGSESAWLFGGGGSSKFFSRPSWQSGPGVPTGSFRTVPDVSLAADLNTGGYLILNGQAYTVGGTSWGAPTWAGFCAMINQAKANAGQPPNGLLGPKIYPLNGTTSFRHITTGNNGLNGVYNAGPAYDLCTGLGVPNVGNLLKSMTSSAPSKIVTVPNPPDFDGDGKGDLLWRNTSSGQVVAWLMNGSAIKTGIGIGSAPFPWVIINSGDFEGNGKSDILWQLGNTSQYGVWFMNGTQVAAIQNFTLPAYAGQICGVADFNGDHLADLVTFNHAAAIVYFWKNTGSLRFVGQSSYAVSATSGWLPVGVTRLNGATGLPSVIWRNANTGEIAAWLMNGFLLSSSVSLGNPGRTVTLNGFGDFSGDGRADLLLFDTASKFVGYWMTNGTPSASSVSLAQVTGTWIPVAAENLDGSGNAEIIWREFATGALSAWQVSGSAWSVYIGSALVGPVWQPQPQPVAP